MTEDARPTPPAEPADEAAPQSVGAEAGEASRASHASGLPQAAPPQPSAPAYRPSYVFLAVVSIISLALDLGTKWWAKARLDDARDIAERSIVLVKDHLAFRFARNQGGAWGLLQDEPESIRRPFFLVISILAIVFIVSLYRKLTPQQWALKWGLPLVLGGALGNLVNRIQFNYVVDFIDFRAGWVRGLNGLLTARPSDHWPTFNIADVAIVAGVILMAIDMFTPRKSTVATPGSGPGAPVTMGGPGPAAPPASAPAIDAGGSAPKET
jgi:signal peptidase II